MNRYYGQLMYCAFLPFSISAPDEKEALSELRKKAPELLSEAEQKEILFHLTRISQADKVTVIQQEVSSGKIANDFKGTHKINRVLPKLRRRREVTEQVTSAPGA